MKLCDVWIILGIEYDKATHINIGRWTYFSLTTATQTKEDIKLLTRNESLSTCDPVNYGYRQTYA